MKAGSLSSQSEKLKQLLSVKQQELEAAQRLNTTLKQRQDVLLASIYQLGAGVSTFATLQHHQEPGHQITGAGGVTDQPSVSPPAAFAPEDRPYSPQPDAWETLLHQVLLQADAAAASQPAAGGGHCSPGEFGRQLSCSASSPNPWSSNPQPATSAPAETTAAPQRPSTALMDDLAAREQGIAAQLHFLAAAGNNNNNNNSSSLGRQGSQGSSDGCYSSRQLASLAANPLRAQQLLGLPAPQRLAELRRWVRQLSLLLPRYDAVQAAPGGSGAALPGWSGWSARDQADRVVDCLVEALLAWGLLDKPGALLRLLSIDMEAGQPCNSGARGWWTHVAAALQLSREQKATLAASWHQVKADTAALLQQHDLLAAELAQRHKQHCHSLDQFGERLHACFARGRSHWWQEQGNKALHLVTKRQPEQTGMHLQQLAEEIFLQRQQPPPPFVQQQQPQFQPAQQQQQQLAEQLMGFATVTSGLPQETSSLPGPTVTAQAPGRLDLIKPSLSGSSSGGPGSNCAVSWPRTTPPPVMTVTTGLPEGLAGPAAALPSPAAAAAARFVPAAAGPSSAGIAAAMAAAAAAAASCGPGTTATAAAAGAAGPDATAGLLQLDPELLLSGARQQLGIQELEHQMASLMARLSVLHVGHSMTLINVLSKRQLAVAAVHSYPLVLDTFALCEAFESLGWDQPEASETAGSAGAGTKTILLVPFLATMPVMPLQSAAAADTSGLHVPFVESAL